MRTMEQINQKVDEKPSFMDQMIKKAVAQAGLPRCDLCKDVIASGALPYLTESGKAMNICLKCVQKALRMYVKANAQE